MYVGCTYKWTVRPFYILSNWFGRSRTIGSREQLSGLRKRRLDVLSSEIVPRHGSPVKTCCCFDTAVKRGRDSAEMSWLVLPTAVERGRDSAEMSWLVLPTAVERGRDSAEMSWLVLPTAVERGRDSAEMSWLVLPTAVPRCLAPTRSRWRAGHGRPSWGGDRG